MVWCVAYFEQVLSCSSTFYLLCSPVCRSLVRTSKCPTSSHVRPQASKTTLSSGLLRNFLNLSLNCFSTLAKRAVVTRTSFNPLISINCASLNACLSHLVQYDHIVAMSPVMLMRETRRQLFAPIASCSILMWVHLEQRNSKLLSL